MKHAYLKRITALAFVTGCCCLLLNQSGCKLILDDIHMDDFNNAWCEKQVVIEGQDVIFLDPCSPQDVSYEAFVDGQPLSNGYVNLDWEVSGDIYIASSAPFMVNGINSGKGTIKLTATVLNEVDCGEGKQSNFKMVATKDVTVMESKLELSSTVCIDASGLGSGMLTLIDPVNGLDYEWTLASGVADLTPKPYSHDCLVENAQGDFSVTVQKNGKYCTNDPVIFKVSVQDCKAQ